MFLQFSPIQTHRQIHFGPSLNSQRSIRNKLYSDIVVVQLFGEMTSISSKFSFKSHSVCLYMHLCNHVCTLIVQINMFKPIRVIIYIHVSHEEFEAQMLPAKFPGHIVSHFSCTPLFRQACSNRTYLIEYLLKFVKQN